MPTCTRPNCPNAATKYTDDGDHVCVDHHAEWLASLRAARRGSQSVTITVALAEPSPSPVVIDMPTEPLAMIPAPESLCRWPGCTSAQIKARKLCQPHYEQARKERRLDEFPAQPWRDPAPATIPGITPEQRITDLERRLEAARALEDARAERTCSGSDFGYLAFGRLCIDKDNSMMAVVERGALPDWLHDELLRVVTPHVEAARAAVEKRLEYLAFRAPEWATLTNDEPPMVPVSALPAPFWSRRDKALEFLSDGRLHCYQEIVDALAPIGFTEEDFHEMQIRGDFYMEDRPRHGQAWADRVYGRKRTGVEARALGGLVVPT